MYNRRILFRYIIERHIGRYSAVIFDVIGVLIIQPDRGEREKRLSELAITEKQLSTAMSNSPLHSAAKHGLIPEMVFWQDVSDHLHVDTTQLLKAAFGGTSSNSDLLSYIKELRDDLKVSVGVLSNSLSDARENFDRLGVNEANFDAIAISSEIGFEKPDEMAFIEVARQLGVSVTESLFIDDKQLNVDGANRAGMLGHLYVSNEETISYLDNIFTLR